MSNNWHKKEFYKNELGQWKTRNYTQGEFLGKGGYARCFQMKDEETGFVYAAKTIKMTSIANSPKARYKIKREIKIHKVLDHPNIVKFYHSFEDDQHVYILLHECKNKTMKELLIQR